jgi:tetratricopeptide (TPR) repeat protein
MLQRLFDAPFTNQLNHLERAQNLVKQIREARRHMEPNAIAEARTLCQSALAAQPGDFRLHENFAEFLEATGALAEASEQWQLVADILPNHFLALYQVGRLLARQKKFGEARASLERALRLRPNLAEAHLELSQIAVAEERTDDALRHLAEARKLRPADAQLHLRQADVFAKQGKRNEAIQSLREAIRVRPVLHEAAIFLSRTCRGWKALGSAAEFEQVCACVRPRAGSPQLGRRPGATAASGRCDG